MSMLDNCPRRSSADAGEPDGLLSGTCSAVDLFSLVQHGIRPRTIRSGGAGGVRRVDTEILAFSRGGLQWAPEGVVSPSCRSRRDSLSRRTQEHRPRCCGGYADERRHRSPVRASALDPRRSDSSTTADANRPGGRGFARGESPRDRLLAVGAISIAARRARAQVARSVETGQSVSGRRVSTGAVTAR